MLGEQTLCNGVNGWGAAEAGTASRKKENKARKPGVVTISTVRETNCASHSRINTLSVNVSLACARGIQSGILIV